MFSEELNPRTAFPEVGLSLHQVRVAVGALHIIQMRTYYSILVKGILHLAYAPSELRR